LKPLDSIFLIRQSPGSPIQFRHRYARRLISSGANLKQVIEVMGYSSITITTDFYGSLTVDQIQDAVDKYLPDDEPDCDY
jgi:site-specific recombinase XerD